MDSCGQLATSRDVEDDFHSVAEEPAEDEEENAPPEPSGDAEEDLRVPRAEVAEEPMARPADFGNSKGKGKGKGKGAPSSGFRNVVVGAAAARAAMDAGLQSTLDALPAELRSRMDAFATEQVAGRRVKLPLNLKAKQRKAL